MSHTYIFEELLFELIETPQDEKLLEFFSDYENSFIIEEEKETFSWFQECLSLNTGETSKQLTELYGVYKELIIIVRDSTTQERIAGINFVAFWGESDCITANLSYVFVNALYRQKGILKKIMNLLPDFLRWQFAPATPPKKVYMFIEQNHPLKMSPENYKRDSEFTGLDQKQRLDIWKKQGAKILDFSYIQPPLSTTQTAEHSLIYSVIGAQESDFDSWLLLIHLKRFFAISVLKGGDIYANTEVTQQFVFLETLAKDKKRVPLCETLEECRLV